MGLWLCLLRCLLLGTLATFHRCWDLGCCQVDPPWRGVAIGWKEHTGTLFLEPVFFLNHSMNLRKEAAFIHFNFPSSSSVPITVLGFENPRLSDIGHSLALASSHRRIDDYEALKYISGAPTEVNAANPNHSEMAPQACQSGHGKKDNR